MRIKLGSESPLAVIAYVAVFVVVGVIVVTNVVPKKEPAIPTRIEQEQQMIAIAERCKGEVTVFAGFEGELFSTKISCTEYKQFRN